MSGIPGRPPRRVPRLRRGRLRHRLPGEAPTLEIRQSSVSLVFRSFSNIFLIILETASVKEWSLVQKPHLAFGLSRNNSPVALHKSCGVPLEDCSFDRAISGAAADVTFPSLTPALQSDGVPDRLRLRLQLPMPSSLRLDGPPRRSPLGSESLRSQWVRIQC